MMGKNHVRVNLGIAAVYLTATSMLVSSDVYTITRIGTKMLSLFIPREISRHFDDGFFHQCFIHILVLMFFYTLGTLLPDIDSKNSTLGRYFCIKVKQHRGWTHSIWIQCIWFTAGIWSLYLRALAAGYFLHVLLDSVSAAGVCWTYPKKRYIVYPNGGFVAPKHKFKWYHAGSEAEAVLTWAILIFCLIFVIYFGCVKKGLLEFWFWIMY